jgi:hypothetical protein
MGMYTLPPLPRVFPGREHFRCHAVEPIGSLGRVGILKLGTFPLLAGTRNPHRFSDRLPVVARWFWRPRFRGKQWVVVPMLPNPAIGSLIQPLPRGGRRAAALVRTPWGYRGACWMRVGETGRDIQGSRVKPCSAVPPSVRSSFLKHLLVLRSPDLRDTSVGLYHSAKIGSQRDCRALRVLLVRGTSRRHSRSP